MTRAANARDAVDGDDARARAASDARARARERDGVVGRKRDASGQASRARSRAATTATTTALEPFRHRVDADPSFVETTLRTLRTATTELLNLSSEGLSYEELYGKAYALVLRKQGDALYNTISDAVTDHLCLHVASKIADVVGDVEFLKDLETRFARHRKSAQMLTDVFIYLDRVHLKRSGNANLEPVGDLVITLWRECVVNNPRIRRRMHSCMLDLIRRERDGESVDRDALQKVTSMLLTLHESVYVDEFEVKMLDETRSYYKAVAQKRIDIDDCPTFLRMAEARLAQEKDRSEAYMAPRTTGLLLEQARNQLLKEMSQSLLHNATSGMVHMLRANQIENLRRMYSLFSTMDDLEGIPDVMFNHLKEIGKSIVNDLENEKNPAQFVEELFKFKEKYDTILIEAFANNRLIESQCNQAYQLVANLNPRSPEYLSLYLDHMLRKSSKDASQSELEIILNRSMGLFHLFHEKDVFENYYRQHLSKRLLNKRSASDDNELAFIGKLKDDCGFTFTSRMEGMFNDMLTSGDLTREFEGVYSRGSGSMEVNVSVLTTGAWPLKVHKTPINLPHECERTCKVFENFYLSRHAGRKLTWQANMGRADIKARFASGEYEISASTLHMCVLMLFNTHETLTTKDISDLTGMIGDELKGCLQALSCVKGKNILTKLPAGKDVSLGDSFQVNQDFSSKTTKVKILSISAKRENDHERSLTKSKIVDDRKPQIEATIVRVMKAKKRLDHNSIVMEVTAQVRNRFMPTPADIKKHIETLIEREYIERDPSDRKMYVYLA